MFPIGNMYWHRYMSLGSEEAKNFGLLIREQRKAQGLRQEDLALATGVGRRYLIELEAGKPTARLGPALLIAQQLGIRFDAPERSQASLFDLPLVED